MERNVSNLILISPTNTSPYSTFHYAGKPRDVTPGYHFQPRKRMGRLVRESFCDYPVNGWLNNNDSYKNKQTEFFVNRVVVINLPKDWIYKFEHRPRVYEPLKGDNKVPEKKNKGKRKSSALNAEHNDEIASLASEKSKQRVI